MENKWKIQTHYFFQLSQEKMGFKISIDQRTCRGGYYFWHCTGIPPQVRWGCSYISLLLSDDPPSPKGNVLH